MKQGDRASAREYVRGDIEKVMRDWQEPKG